MISIEDVYDILYAESNGHVTDDVISTAIGPCDKR